MKAYISFFFTLHGPSHAQSTLLIVAYFLAWAGAPYGGLREARYLYVSTCKLFGNLIFLFVFAFDLM